MKVEQIDPSSRYASNDLLYLKCVDKGNGFMNLFVQFMVPGGRVKKHKRICVPSQVIITSSEEIIQ